MGQELRRVAGPAQSDILPPTLSGISVFQDANVVFSEGVGHIQPVYAVVYAGVVIRFPQASSGKDSVEDTVTLDIAENAGELAREVNLFRHAHIIQARNDTVNKKHKKT